MPQTIRARLLVENVHGISIVTFADERLASEEVIHEVGEQLLSHIDEARPENVLLNFREVQAMSSTMLAVLLKLSRKVASIDGQLKLCCIAPDLLDIFRITRFDRMFEIHEEESSALDSF
jgi:anti-sigma B factor antagonist